MGYDWARLHAALNDLPAALLLAAVLFDLLGVINKRDSLQAAGFWCLVFGVAGGALAAVAGEFAEDSAAHSDRAHELMETHETLALVSLGLFAVLLAWRLVRRTLAGRRQAAFSTLGVLGVGLLVSAARLGGNLVFDHAAGLSDSTLERVVDDRHGGHRHDEAEDHEHDAAADSAGHRH